MKLFAILMLLQSFNYVQACDAEPSEIENLAAMVKDTVKPGRLWHCTFEKSNLKFELDGVMTAAARRRDPNAPERFRTKGIGSENDGIYASLDKNGVIKFAGMMDGSQWNPQLPFSIELKGITEQQYATRTHTAVLLKNGKVSEKGTCELEEIFD